MGIFVLYTALRLGLFVTANYSLLTNALGQLKA